MSSQDIPSLVNSLKKHKNFRHMAKYSLSCLAQNLQPPSLGWESNVRSAVELGCIQAIADLAAKHASNEEILSMSTRSLISITQESAKNVDLIFESGALTHIMKAITEESDLSDETMKCTMDLIETVAIKNPTAMIENDLLKGTLDLLKSHKTSQVIAGGCARTLEKLSKVQAGANQLIETDGALDLLDLCDTEGAHVDASIKILERLARKKECVSKLKKVKAISRIVKVLERQSDDSASTGAGGRLLGKLASGELETVLADIKSGEMDTAKMQVTVGLLSNLALNEEHADAIVSGNGVHTLVHQFDKLALASKFSTIRAFGRLATSEANIETLVNEGATKVLIETLKSEVKTAEICTAVTPSIAKLCTTAKNVAEIEELGGFEAIVECMEVNTSNIEHSSSALEVMEKLACCEYDMGKVVKYGALEATVESLKKNIGNVDLCISGLRCLTYMADRVSHMDRIVKAGVFPLLDNILIKHMTSKATVTSAVYLLTSLSLVEANKKYISMDKTIKSVVEAVQYHHGEVDVLSTAQELMSEVITPDQIQEAVHEMKFCHSMMSKQKTKENVEKLRNCVGVIGALSLDVDNVALISKHGGIKIVKEVLDNVTSSIQLPHQEALLCSAAATVDAIATAGSIKSSIAEKIKTVGLVSSVIQSIKIHPKLPKHCVTASRTLNTLATLHPDPKAFVQAGVIEAVSTAVRANVNNPNVLKSCGDILSHVSLDQSCAVEIAKRGGTRQVIKTIAVNASDVRAPMRLAMASMMQVASVVSMTHEGAEILGKQGVVECVSQVVSQPNLDDEIMDIASDMMGKFAKKEDAGDAVNNMVKKFKVQKTLRLNENSIKEMGQLFQRIGGLAIAEGMAEEVIKHKGDEVLIMAVDKLTQNSKSLSSNIRGNTNTNNNNNSNNEATNTRLIGEAIRSLGQLAKNTKLQVGAEAVPVLVRIMKDDENIMTDCMDSLHSLCDDKDTSKALVEAGGVELIMDAVNNNPEDKKSCSSAFKSLERLANDEELYEKVASKGALEMALDHLDDAEELPVGQVAEVASLVNTFCNSENEIEICADHDAMGTCLRAVRRLCKDGKPEEAILFEKVTKLAEKMISSEKTEAEIMVKDFNRLIMGSSPFKSNPEVVKSLVDSANALLTRLEKKKNTKTLEDGTEIEITTDNMDEGETLCEIDESIFDRLKKNIVDFTISSMDELGGNMEAIDKCGQLMSRCGGQQKSMEIVLNQLEEVLPFVKPRVDPKTGEEYPDQPLPSAQMVEQLGGLVKKLTNFLAVDDMVNDDNSEKILNAIVTSADVLQRSKDRLSAAKESENNNNNNDENDNNDSKTETESSTNNNMTLPASRNRSSSMLTRPSRASAPMSDGSATSKLPVPMGGRRSSVADRPVRQTRKSGSDRDNFVLNETELNDSLCAALRGVSRLIDTNNMSDEKKKETFELFSKIVEEEDNTESDLMTIGLSGLGAIVDSSAGLKLLVKSEKCCKKISGILQEGDDNESDNVEVAKDLMTRVMRTMKNSASDIVQSTTEDLHCNDNDDDNDDTVDMDGIILVDSDSDKNADAKKKKINQNNDNTNEHINSAAGLTSLLVAAQLADGEEAAQCIQSMVSIEGGEDMLWDILGSTEAKALSTASTVTMVLDTVEAQKAESVTVEGKKVMASLKPQQIKACLPSVLTTVIQAREACELLDLGDESNKLKEAAKLLTSAVPMFLRIDVQDDSSLKSLVESGAVNEMLGLLKTTTRILSGLDEEDNEENDEKPRDNVESTISVLKCVRHVLNGKDEEQIKTIVKTITDEKMADCLKTSLRHSFTTNEEELLTQSLQTVIDMAEKIGVRESGLTRDHMKIIAPIKEVSSTSNEPEKQEMTRLATKCINKLGEVFTDEPVKILGEKVETVQEVMVGVENIEAAVDDEGTVFYFNHDTGESSWERPPELVKLHENLEEIINMTTDDKSCQITLSKQNAVSFTKALKSHAKDPETCTTIAKALREMVRDGESTKVMVENGGIDSIIEAVNANPNNKKMVRMLTALMERFSRNDHFKERIGESGAIDLVINIGMMNNLEDEDLIRLCLSTLANLAFNSDANIRRVMDAKGVDAVERAMQEYPESARVLENAMCLLSNLMFETDENKLIIGQTTGDEITHVIRVHPEDSNLFKMALRALGNLSFCDENIRFVVDEGATECIVKGMRINSDDDEALRLSIEVIGNFASLDEPEDELEDTTPVGMVVHQQGGIKEVVNVCNNNMQETSLLKSSMDALSNLSSVMGVAALMVSDGVVQLIIEILKAHDWDEELVEHTIPVLTALTYEPTAVVLMIDLDAIQVVTSIMESHCDHKGILLACQLALTNLASVEETRFVMKEQDTLQTVLENLRNHLDNIPFITEVFNTLTRMCVDEELSLTIAANGVSTLFGAMRKYSDNPEFLAEAFILIGHLAFLEDNLRSIIQCDGIALIMESITEHPDCHKLMVRSIQTLDNIAMASKEYANIVIESNGKEIIQEIMDAYEGDPEIDHHGGSALLSLTAIESLAETDKIMEKNTKRRALKIFEEEQDKVIKDALSEYRVLLKSGVDVKQWHKKIKGLNQPLNITVASSWKAFIIGENQLRVAEIQEILEGSSLFPKKKFSSKKAIPGNSFTIKTVSDVIFDGALHIECSSAAERNIWMKALQTMTDVYSDNPDKLAPQA
eukprot:TRINITY_DN1382_c0_g3_i1.p1 TRINITY_DN1382_c0_g3~~TRINITY_DN1382_c0_g3_i1.p1  ORF type:complete len:2670 (-),score=895.52 TRINITY_DN1382_c0_g3_i1:394-8403(-)